MNIDCSWACIGINDLDESANRAKLMELLKKTT
jgi:hypothetical protein